MRRGSTGLSALVQTVLQQNPFSGQIFVFRGRRGDLIKVRWWDGEGLYRRDYVQSFNRKRPTNPRGNQPREAAHRDGVS